MAQKVRHCRSLQGFPVNLWFQGNWQILWGHLYSHIIASNYGSTASVTQYFSFSALFTCFKNYCSFSFLALLGTEFGTILLSTRYFLPLPWQPNEKAARFPSNLCCTLIRQCSCCDNVQWGFLPIYQAQGMCVKNDKTNMHLNQSVPCCRELSNTLWQGMEGLWRLRRQPGISQQSTAGVSLRDFHTTWWATAAGSWGGQQTARGKKISIALNSVIRVMKVSSTRLFTTDRYTGRREWLICVCHPKRNKCLNQRFSISVAWHK